MFIMADNIRSRHSLLYFVLIIPLRMHCITCFIYNSSISSWLSLKRYYCPYRNEAKVYEINIDSSKPSIKALINGLFNNGQINDKLISDISNARYHYANVSRMTSSGRPNVSSPPLFFMLWREAWTSEIWYYKVLCLLLYWFLIVL